jgi:hypothetical protein
MPFRASEARLEKDMQDAPAGRGGVFLVLRFLHDVVRQRLVGPPVEGARRRKPQAAIRLRQSTPAIRDDAGPDGLVFGKYETVRRSVPLRTNPEAAAETGEVTR